MAQSPSLSSSDQEALLREQAGGSARSVNDAGEIVGDGLNPDGELHAFLLRQVAPAGEPSTSDRAPRPSR